MANNLSLFYPPLSGNPSIDGLISQGQLPFSAEYPYQNYINFSFDTSLINAAATSTQATAMTSTDEQAVRNVLNYLNSVTGIYFNEVPAGTTANTNLVFALAPLGPNVISSDTYSYTYNPNAAQVLNMSDSILVNSSAYGVNSLPPGTYPYMGLLQAVGEALGLRPPDSSPGANPPFPQQYNNGGATIMAANNTTTFNNYTTLDLGALNWLYNGKGLQNPGIIPSGTAASGTWTMVNPNSSFGIVSTS
jgi:hypothetical protein